MTHVDYGTYGAKRQTWVGKTARSLLDKFLRKNPDADNEELVELMLPCVMKDEDIAREVLAYWLPRNRRSREPEPKTSERERKKQREARKQESEKTEAAFTRAIIKHTLSLDTVMHDGREYGEWTGTELKKLSGVHAVVAKRAGKKKVSDVWTDKELKALQA